MKNQKKISKFETQLNKIGEWFVKFDKAIWNVTSKIYTKTINFINKSWIGRIFARLTTWLKITIFSVFGLIFIGLIVWAFSTPASTKPYFEMGINSPSAVEFQDDRAMNFITNNTGEYSDEPASISLPEPNNDRELSTIQPLYVYYNLTSGSYSPAFKMNLTEQDIENNIRITPFIKGKWSASGSEGLFFTPARDWPADQNFTITVNKKLLNNDIKINTFKKGFSTNKLSGKLESFDVYPDFSKQKSMVAVGVISFNYAIDTKNFNDKISIKLDGKKIDFNVKFDSFYRTVFITSDAITVKNKPQKVRMMINGIAALNGTSKSASIDATSTIESQDNFFKVSNISTTVVDNQQGEPEQLLLLNLTSTAKNVKWSDNIDVYLLPKNKNSDDDRSHDWKSDEISDDILNQSEKINIRHIEFANKAGVYQYAFAYDVSEKDTRYIYARVKSGIMSDIGFSLKNGADKIMQVPYPSKELKIAGSGALLSLSGEKQLAIMARGGVDTAYVKLSKVRESEINHLISQTYDVFSDIDFKGYSFNETDISVVFNKKISFADTSFKKVNYSSVDLGEYLNRSGNDRSGIFIVQIGSSESNAEHNDKKLILLTDLGIVRKINSDNSSSVFVSSLGSGKPVSGANVAVLGRNGRAIWNGETNSNGRANTPMFAHSEYRQEKEPVAFVVTYGSDVSFIPYDASYEQRVEFSKFDIDGTYVSESNPMNAYLFSDRGIYRPGEKFIIGGVVKETKFKSLAGVPVKIEVRDARSKIIIEKTFSLTSDGMFDIEDRLSGQSPIGDYQVRLYSLNDKNKTKDILGTTNIRVEEFVPDTLKISAGIKNIKTKGWIAPSDLVAEVSLRNLFGTPAGDRRISSRAVMTPAQFSFPEFKEYSFTKNFISGTGLANKSSVTTETLHQTLGDTKTNSEGHAAIDIKFDSNINPGTYVLAFTATGFEGDSGKSVQAATSTKVSDAKYLIGYKTSGDLGYINKNAKRSVNIIAINSDVARTSVDKLTMRIVKKQTLTSLIKDYNDYYKYQTVVREKIIKTQNVTIPAKGMDINLDTASSGNYYVQILDESDKILAHVDYFIAGAENLALKSDQQAELKIKLNKAEYAPGSTIDISITSPYIGSGLITIEKDKVYAHRWFKTTTTSTVQTITLPDDFEGTGYINVSFVRDVNSRDVFTAPYTYAVAPFATDKSKRTINIDLKTADVVRDKKLTVRYTTDKSARMMIFAVNEGILQVAKYQNPKPINHFFKKSALQVTTYQILSLLLPEYKILREFAKTGGGDYDDMDDMELMKQNVTNPFARVIDEPVAFYSGIVNTVAGIPNVMTFDIPDHFNGGVRVYAVAVSNTAMGSAETESKIQSPVIISASAPLMAVPGDEFTVNAVISNMTENSGTNATVNAFVATSDNLKIGNDKEIKLSIPESSEQLWKFGLIAGDILGNADINITASVHNKDGIKLSANTSKSTLSIRPTSLYETNITTKFTTDKKTSIKDFQIDMYNQMLLKELYVSNHSSVLVKPLLEYLDNYSYPCSEQTVSKALPYALLPTDEFLNIDHKKSTDKITSAINVLKNRQNDDGSFSLWEGISNFGTTGRDSATNANAAYVTAYVVQFLTIAKDNGFNVPNNMLSRGVDFLRTYSGKNIHNDFDARTKAFAIYAVSRNGYVTTSYIDTFTEYANKNIKDWQSELSGAYIASAYKLLKQNDKADNIISKYKLSDQKKFIYYYDFANNITDDANYAYLVNNHFAGDISKDRFKKILDAVNEYIQSGNYSAFTSAAAIMALSGNANELTEIVNSVSVMGMSGKESVNLHPTDSKSGHIYQTKIPNNINKIEITCNDCNRDRGVFYTIIQQGFAKKSSNKTNGIEIVRDYYDKDENKITSATVGDDITVKISVRATDGADYIDNVVIADLLPAGFSVVSDSVSGSRDFSEVREDRVLVYKSITKSVSQITYKVKITTAGTFTVPAIQAISMYNPQITGVAKSGTFKVVNAKTE